MQIFAYCICAVCEVRNSKMSLSREKRQNRILNFTFLRPQLLICSLYIGVHVRRVIELPIFCINCPKLLFYPPIFRTPLYNNIKVGRLHYYHCSAVKISYWITYLFRNRTTSHTHTLVRLLNLNLQDKLELFILIT